jgi:hypothetical protein
MSMPHDTAYYRQRADRLREVATAPPLSAEDRDTLIFFADHFDRLADDAESASSRDTGK